MHCDKKLGLGLGILLVGVVAALFFRHEDPPAPPAAELADPGRLDRAIAEKDISPYPDTARRGETAGRTVREEAWALPDFLHDAADSASGPPPNPIAVTPRPSAGPEHNRAWRPAGEAGGAASDGSPRPASGRASPSSLNADLEAVRKGGQAPSPVWRLAPQNTSSGSQSPVSDSLPDGVVLHQVVQGDTLSGLAARYLGSSGRFLEIYEANRDVLRSPNDLRVGMTLRIPTRRPGMAEIQRSRAEVAGAQRSAAGVAGAERSGAPVVAPVPIVSQNLSTGLPAADRVAGTGPGAPVAAPVPAGSVQNVSQTTGPRLRFQPARRSPLLPAGESPAVTAD